MPWWGTDPVTERLQFVQDALNDRFTMAQGCDRDGVSRKTGYQGIDRYAEGSRRPLRTAASTSPPPTAESRTTSRRSVPAAMHPPHRVHGKCRNQARFRGWSG